MTNTFDGPEASRALLISHVIMEFFRLVCFVTRAIPIDGLSSAQRTAVADRLKLSPAQLAQPLQFQPRSLLQSVPLVNRVAEH